MGASFQSWFVSCLNVLCNKDSLIKKRSVGHLWHLSFNVSWEREVDQAERDLFMRDLFMSVFWYPKNLLINWHTHSFNFILKIYYFMKSILSRNQSIPEFRLAYCLLLEAALPEPIRSQCTFPLPPENIRKPYGFLMLSRVEKGCIGNEWVKGNIKTIF